MCIVIVINWKNARLALRALPNFGSKSWLIVWLSVSFVLKSTCDTIFGTLVTPRRSSCTCLYWCAHKSPQKASNCYFCCCLLPNVVLSLLNCSILLLLSLWRMDCWCCGGLVLSSVANLVHLCGEDVGSNPAWTISCRWIKHSIPCEILCSLLGRAPGSGT